MRGEVEIGLQQMPELMAVPGVDVVGPVPGEMQSITIFRRNSNQHERCRENRQDAGKILDYTRRRQR